jgi:hypothetical protein
MPSFQYTGMTAPGSVAPRYKLAIFASFPITRLAVIRDAETMRHEAGRRERTPVGPAGRGRR